jgi:hypothetical protein
MVPALAGAAVPAVQQTATARDTPATAQNAPLRFT